MVQELLIAAAVLVWSIVGVAILFQRPDSMKISLTDAVLYGPLVLLMWCVLWLATIDVRFQRRK